jgi:CDP-paratose 2-epimerase
MISGQAFNMGGGIKNTISLLELLEVIKEISGIHPDIIFKDWRPSDQKYYVSDFTKFKRATNWEPVYHTKDGITLLFQWLKENAGIILHNKQDKRARKILHSQLEPADK